MKFKVTITETLSKAIYIEAETADEAKYEAQKQYYKGEHVLDDTNFIETKFETEVL